MQRKTWLGTVALVAAALLAPAPAPAATTVTLGYVAGNDFTPAFVAKDQGFFQKHGLDVTLTRLTVITTAPQGLLANSLQISGVTGPLFINAVGGGLDLVAIGGMTRNAKNAPAISLVARTGASLKSAADFRGKKIGVPGLNSFADLVLHKWFRDNKVDPSGITFVETAFPQMSDLLKSGQLDAVAVVDPIRARIVGSGVGYKVADYVTDVRENVPVIFWAASRAWAAKNPAAVKGFHEAIAEAVEWMAKHPAEAKATEQKYLTVTSPAFPAFDQNISAADLRFFTELAPQQKPLDAGKLILSAR